MKKPPTSETEIAGRVSILSISPIEDDHTALEECLRRTQAQNGAKWTVFRSSSLAAAQQALQQVQFSVVICERDLLPGTWKDILAELMLSSDPPTLIVTSRMADEYLWAEALNLGASDVLQKPFDKSDVIHIVTAAFGHWMTQHERQSTRIRDQRSLEQWHAVAG